MIAYNATHIRPLAVSPLTHPESVPIPWGFSFSASATKTPSTFPQQGLVMTAAYTAIPVDDGFVLKWITKSATDSGYSPSVKYHQ
jgi:hypothetical protein